MKEVDKALDLWKEMLSQELAPDIVIYSALMDGLFKAKRPLEAEQLLVQMEADGCWLDTIACVIFIEGLCNNGRLDNAISMLQHVENKGFPPDIKVYNSLIDAFFEAGRCKEALDLFSVLPSIKLKPNKETYFVLVKGLCSRRLAS